MKTRRPLLWATAVGAVALTLVHGTASVRAAGIASSLGAIYDASDSPTVRPYSWTEFAHEVARGVAYQVFMTMMGPTDYVGTGSHTDRALFTRALD